MMNPPLTTFWRSSKTVRTILVQSADTNDETKVLVDVWSTLGCSRISFVE